MDVFESCRLAATQLYGMDHPEVYDPRLPAWALQHHVEECQKLEDEMITAELSYGVDEMNAQWEEEYNKQIEEEIAAEDEAIRENGYYPLEPPYDPSLDNDDWPDYSILQDWRAKMS